jgi:pimeloyl-ACP methyl ester carboxylesterase
MTPALESLTGAEIAACSCNASIVRRHPFYFESQGQSVFAWLHQATQSTSHGIVMCAPFGYEQVHAHRNWRYLADALAAAGFRVLRLDYHGTGDSAGSDEDPDRVTTWMANVRDALAYLRTTAGCTNVSLLGLRLGATLAVQAATLEDIDSLLLWAPVTSGRHFVRELKALNLTASIKGPPPSKAPDDIDAAGFVVTKQTADELGKIDLLKITPRSRRALIVARDDVPEDRRLLDYLCAQNVDAAQQALPGYADMMAEPHFTKIASKAIGEIVDWFSAGLPTGAPRIEAAAAPMQQSAFVGDGIRERILTFGDNGQLVGIMTEPANEVRAELPMIVMLNGGIAYRIGPSRLHVLLARSLALRGFRCLRLDSTGRGDSVVAGEAGIIDSYDANTFADIETALPSLGQEPFVLLGLCSGAYFAFQAAAQLRNPALVESVLINPLTFFWKDGMSLDALPTKDDIAFDYYLKSAWQPAKWLKLLSGQTKIGFGGAFSKLWRFWHTAYPSQQGAELIDGPLGHPERDDLTADLDRVARRGRRLACFISSADPGYHIMNVRAKRKVQELVQAGVLSVKIIENADHTFSFRVPRREVIDAICEHLCRRYTRT